MGLVSAIINSVMPYHVKPVSAIGSSIPPEHIFKQDLAAMMDQRTHPAVRMYDLVENGELKKALIKDMETPPVTCVGELADSIFNTIAHLYNKLKTTEKTKQAARKLFESMEEQETVGCKALSASEIACVPMAVGLSLKTKYSATNCTYNNPVDYDAHFNVFDESNKKDASKLGACINQYIDQCKTNCFFCWPDPTQGRRIGSHNFTYEFQSKHYSDRTWKIYVAAPENIYDHTRFLVKYYSDVIIGRCESSEKQVEGSLLGGLLAGGAGLVSLAVMVGGVIYYQCRAQTNEQEERVVLVDDDALNLEEVTTEVGVVEGDDSILLPDEPQIEEDSSEE
jgi:hypothetical protein